MSYYLLVEKTERFGWSIQFGDKEKESVEFERDDYVRNGISKKNLRVIKAKSARKSDCDAAVSALKEKGA